MGKENVEAPEAADAPETWDDALEESYAAPDESQDAEAEDNKDLMDDAEAAVAERTEGAPVIDEEPLRPNTAWSSERRALFDKIAQMGQEGVDMTPRQAQEFMLEVFKEEQQRASQAVEQLRSVSNRLEQYDNQVGTLQQAWAMQGLTPEAGLSRLVQFEQWLYQDPASALSWVAGQVGLDLNTLGQQQPYVDPELQQLRDEVSRMRWQNEQQTVQQERQMTENILGGLKQFRDQVDENGNRVHPYFAEVLPQMVLLAQSGQFTDPQSAYETACMMNESVRSRYMDDLQRTGAATQPAPGQHAQQPPVKADKGGKIRASGGQTGTPAGGVPDNWDDAFAESVRSINDAGY